MKNALKRLNPALPGLLAGITIYGAAVWIAGIWLVSDKLAFSIGLFVGIACAWGMAIHIASVLAASVAQGGYSKQLSVLSVIRYLVVGAVLFLMMYLRLGDLIAAFIGIFGLKISAYAQPQLRKLRLFNKFFE